MRKTKMAELSSCLKTTADDNAKRALIDPKQIWRYLNSGDCSTLSITSEIMESLFHVLEDDCSSFTVLDCEVNQCLSENLQEVTLPCLVKIIHLVHSGNLSNRHQCELDVPSLLKRFLGNLSIKECQHLQVYFTRAVSILNAIPLILYCEDVAALQTIFVGVDCFEDIITVLNFECENPDEQNMLYTSCVHALHSIMEHSPAAKEVFKASKGYEKICSYLKRMKSPSKDFIQSFLNWAVEGGLSKGSKVNNVDVVLLLLDWLPFLSVANKRFVTESLRHLSLCSIHNAILCSTRGVFCKTVELLKGDPRTMDYIWAEALIGLLEALGSHSVTSPELKQMISLFTPLEDGTQVPYALRLLQALVKMSFSSSRLRAKYFFDLHHPSAGISVPGIQKWPGNSCTFHAWICVEAIKPENGTKQKAKKMMTHYRRNLYSFFTISGVGMEAFLSTSGHLVVAVCRKKDYTTITVPNCKLCDQKWHSVAIAHYSPRRLFGQNTVSVYVDGKLKINCPLKFPSLSEELKSFHVGCGGLRTVCVSQDRHSGFPELQHSVSHYRSTIAAGTQDHVWGVSTSLQGQLGPVCVFSEGLQEDYIIALHAAGPNDLNLFQPVDGASSTQPLFAELCLKLVVYFNSKAGRDHMCSDLVPTRQGRVPFDGRLTGHRCTTWDIKDGLRCIGGVKIFLPLLELICYFEPPSEQSGQRDNLDFKQSSDENVASAEKGCDSMSDKESGTTDLEDPIETSNSVDRCTNPGSACADQQDEWVLIDNNYDLQFYRKQIHKLCKSQTSHGVGLFIFLLLSILRGHEVTDEEFVETVSHVGGILRTMDSRFINVPVLKSLQALVECVTNETVLQSIYDNLLFDFRLWSSSEFTVRIGHIQFISTRIKDHPSRFRSNYGVRFLLDVITLYYGECASMENAAGQGGDNGRRLTQEETKIIRASLLGLIKFYLQEKVKREEVLFLVEYLTCLTEPEQAIEVLDILLSLCERASNSKMAKRLSDPKHIPVFVTMLLNHRNEQLRLKVIKLMADIMCSPNVPEGNRSCWHLRAIGLSALTEHLAADVSEPLVKRLLTLAVSEHDESKGVGVLLHYHVVMAVIELIHNEGVETKLLVSHMILRSIDASHLSLSRCAKEYGWHVTLLRLITGACDVAASSGSELDNGVVGEIQERKKKEEELIDTVLEIVFRVMWKGIEGYEDSDWKLRGQAFAAVSYLPSMENFVVPSRVVERRLLELCVQGAVQDIRVSGETAAAETQNALMVMRLVEDFLFTSGSIAGAGPDNESETWSIKLVEQVVLLLEVLDVWGKDEENEEWEEMAQVGVRILLAFISRPETEYCATASSKLSKLLKSWMISSQGELCFILGRLHQAFIASREQDGCHNYTFIVPVIRVLLREYRDRLPLAIYMPAFTDRTPPQREEDFVGLVESDELKALMRQQIYPGMRQYENTFSQSSRTSGRFWMECLTGLTESVRNKERTRQQSREKFREQITEPFERLHGLQQERIAKVQLQEEHQSNNWSRQWKVLKRTLTSERSPWGSRSAEEIHWKLSSTETFQRMRLKLTRNFAFTSHADASRALDKSDDETGAREVAVPVRVAKEAVVENVAEDVLEFDDLVGPHSPTGKERARTLSETEREVLSEDCELITLMDIVPGKLDITTNNVYFHSAETAGRDFHWPLELLREVHLRRHNLRRSALEFFLVDQTNYFLNFNKQIRNKVYKKIMSLRPRNLYYIGARSPANLLRTSGLTEKWVRREISNFEYLMQLNTIAGRTYNDLSQYPVFPWVLVDYDSEKLCLDDPAVYRDLSKPVGALNPKKVPFIKERYDSFVDPCGEVEKFHYGSHYSSSAAVLHFLLRVEPFTTLHINLQSGKFDCADRQFHSISASWDSIYEKGGDFKELIPEFFYFADFLVNSNRFDLGRLQRGEVVDDVILPRWARSPEDFVYKHRQALESDHVSSHLHQWIDLIFGYKQKGPAAVEALNVFYYCTYEGAVDLDAITDPVERVATEGMINNFGQTPIQLLTQPHPQRMSADETATNKAAKTAGTSRPLANVFKNIEKLKTYFVKVSDTCDPLVFAAVSKIKTWSLIHHGLPENMFTISQSGILGFQDWLPYSKTKSKPFTFELDLSLASNKLRRCVAGPFSPDLKITPRLFAMTHDAKLIFIAGHWDNSLQVFATRAKQLTRIVAHADIVTCVSLDEDGHHLITGSRDTTCRLWEISHHGGVAHGVKGVPLQTLYGHDKPVTCVAMSWELDMAVSGSQDGTCIVYTARKGEYVVTLRPMGMQPSDQAHDCHVTTLALSEYGDIVVFCKQGSSRTLCRYSVNGKLLAKDGNLKQDVEDVIICDEFVITGGANGRLGIRVLYSFQEVQKINLLVPIRAVSLARDNSHIFVCLQDGKLIVIGVEDT